MELNLNLQFFAKDGPGGEKTEQPTTKRLEDARKKGQVAKSKEIAMATGLLCFFLMLKFVAARTGQNLMYGFSGMYSHIPELTRSVTGHVQARDMTLAVGQIFMNIIKLCLPYMLISAVVAFVTDLVQVKWKFSTEPMKFKGSKFNPISGMKKIISMQSLVELIKSVFKILLIAWLTYSTFKESWVEIFLLYEMDLLQSISFICLTVVNFGIKLSVFYMLIAAADYVYQKRKFTTDMMMTKQEIKDEYKNSEGDPEIKGKIRLKMREASRRRMMANVPKADVVITNPTHYAVAVSYDSKLFAAPTVVAKGEGYLAQRIKELAKENNVEIVENKPLARMLYFNVDIDEQIPPELYQAVAEVLAYVYKLKGKV